MAYDEDTPTRRELILRAIVTLIDANGGPTDLLVHRFRGVPVLQEDLPATIVYPIVDPAEPETHGVPIERRLLVRLEHRVEGVGVAVDATSPDELLDPLLSWANYQLLTDRTLGGLCTDIDIITTRWDSLELDAHYGAVGIDAGPKSEVDGRLLDEHLHAVYCGAAALGRFAPHLEHAAG